MAIEIGRMETDEDILGKAYVHWKTWHAAYPGLISAAFLDAFTLERCEANALKWGKEGLLVAKDGGRVVGFTGFGASRGEPDMGEVFALYALPEYWGKGVGKALMDAALAQLQGYDRICLWVLQGNARAIRFYEKCGFRADGAVQSDERLAATEIRMILDRA